MNESNQPFTDHVTRAKRLTPAKYAWIIAGVLAVVAIGFSAWFVLRQHTLDIQKSQAKLEEAKASLTKAAAENLKALEKIEQLKSQVSGLEKEKEQAAQTHKGLEEEMRAALESKDVTISQLQGKLTVSILDRILFNSGEADLMPGGEVVLQKIASFLAQHPSLKIHVIGHTDNVPIRASARSRFASNWELSTARALAAVRFLTERAGVDPRRLGAVGYGEFRPVADNSTPEGRARNRRIAITILADELAGVDTVPTSTPTAPANPPPAEPAPENSMPVEKQTTGH